MATLSPDEVLGLSGLALDGRVRRAFHRLPAAAVRDLHARLRADAGADGLVYEFADRIEVIRVLPRPLVATPDQLQYVHRVTLALLDALRRLAARSFTDPELRRALPLSPDEDAFLREVWRPEHEDAAPLYARFDAVCDFSSAGWRDGLRYLEPNLSGVGGIHYAPVAEALVARDVVPLLRAYDPELALEPPRDQRDLFLQLLLDHARALGRPGRRICLLEPRYVHGGNVEEQSALCVYLRRRGVDAVHADPSELALDGDEVLYAGAPIDVAYRDYEVRDLLRLSRETGMDLAPIRRLFARNQVVSGVCGEFDHKAGFELLTDPEAAARLFSAEERRLFARHVLWTRRLYPRRTTLPEGHVGDLLEYVRRERDRLVLKPDRGYGGAGVVIGASTSQGEWEAAIEAGLRAEGDPHRALVVQAAVALPSHEFPVVGAAGDVRDEPFYTVMGFTATDAGLAVLGRASQKQVVNVAQRGGLCVVLSGRPPELRADSHPPGHVRTDIHPPRPSTRAELDAHVATLRHLDAALDLLGWDEETYLPEGARGERGEQIAALEGLRHAHLTSPLLGELIDDARAAALDPLADRNLALLARRRHQALALPERLVRAFAEARSRSLAAWEEARRTRDFSDWAPALSALVDLARERARALAGAGDPYDALLDEHDPGMTRAVVGPLLASLCERLVPLARQVARPDAPRPPWLTDHVYEDSQQELLAREILGAIGFDLRRGRLDRSTHPFTLAAGFHDVRLTIRAYPNDPLPAVLGALHEGGHGLYDQGYDPAHRGTLVGNAPGMAIHESQSRLWENLVGRSRAFWTWWFPRMQARFPGPLGGVDLDGFLAELRCVRPGLVRVDADEVTYNLHIALRYGIEVDLLDGYLRVADLPLAFAEASQRLLGLTPPDDLQGCMQDVHWAIGAFGYFPSYTLGNLYAAQLFEAFRAAEPDWDDHAARGDLAPLLAWLRRHVHRRGSVEGGAAIVEQASGKGLSAGPFLQHLERRYLRGED